MKLNSNNNITMTEMFKGYSNYSDDEYKRIWKDGIIVVDANILLNFYRYSESTREEIFKILKKQENRLWIPYQVGKEFFNNKNTVMINSYKEYDTLIAFINKKLKEATEEINKKKNNQLDCKNELNKIIGECFKKIENILNKEKKDKKPVFEKNLIEERILNLFNKNIENQYDEEEYETIKKEGLERFENKIPPGYKDNQKDENGDYYIFYSLIKKAKIDKKDIIFITDDIKEDWFNEFNGEIHGGRAELLNEFFKETGKLLIIYTSDGFVKSYNKNIEKQQADEKIINELINVRNKEHILQHSNFTNTLRTKQIFNILECYKTDLMNPSGEAIKPELLDHISFILKNMNIQNYDKHLLQREIFKIKNYLYETNDTEYINKKVLNLIEKIININNNFILTNHDNVIHIKDIRKNYIDLLIELKSCKTRAEHLELYQKISKNIEKHINYIEQNPSNYDFLLIKKLQNLINGISANVKRTSLAKNEKIISQIEEILADEDITLTTI